MKLHLVTLAVFVCCLALISHRVPSASANSISQVEDKTNNTSDEKPPTDDETTLEEQEDADVHYDNEEDEDDEEPASDDDVEEDDDDDDGDESADDDNQLKRRRRAVGEHFQLCVLPNGQFTVLKGIATGVGQAVSAEFDGDGGLSGSVVTNLHGDDADANLFDREEITVDSGINKRAKFLEGGFKKRAKFLDVGGLKKRAKFLDFKRAKFLEGGFKKRAKFLDFKKRAKFLEGGFKKRAKFLDFKRAKFLDGGFMVKRAKYFDDPAQMFLRGGNNAELQPQIAPAPSNYHVRIRSRVLPASSTSRRSADSSTRFVKCIKLKTGKVPRLFN